MIIRFSETKLAMVKMLISRFHDVVLLCLWGFFFLICAIQIKFMFMTFWSLPQVALNGIAVFALASVSGI